MKKTKRLLAVLLSVLAVLASLSLSALADTAYDNYTSEDAIAVALADAGLEREDLDYLYVDHEEDFKLEKYPVWELKFGSDNVMYEYYVSTYNNEIIPRYTSAELKGETGYNFLVLFINLIIIFMEMFAPAH